jgi:hypothetical protein
MNNLTFEVNYSILVEERTDTYMGSSRSDMQYLRTTVQAPSVGQAQAIVEAQFGGSRRVVVHGVRQIW